MLHAMPPIKKLFPTRPKPVVLLVLDGWGVQKSNEGNAITLAKTPNFNNLISHYPVGLLRASGEAVGLPVGVMGNSEVGHLTLGAGSTCDQELQKINKAIRSGQFFSNQAFAQAIKHVKTNSSRLHLLGLVSDGRVHSSFEHLSALLQLCKKQGIIEVYLHIILDGRDTLYNAGQKFVTKLQQQQRILGLGKIATISGRFYAMDRDNHWERTGQAYAAMAAGQGRQVTDPLSAISEAYAQKNYDEEFLPTVICQAGRPIATVQTNDAVIFFNYRADRARQLTKCFVLKKIEQFARGPQINNLLFVGFTEYERGLPLLAAFDKEDPRQTLGEVLVEHKLRQLRLAETEKYAHVTYFFNGGRETKAWGEDHVLIPSPRVSSYATKPVMSAPLITDHFLAILESDQYDFILVNFANPDMVGHTGNLAATIKAIAAVDKCLGKIAASVLAKNGALLVTADHGNAESKVDLQTNTILKEHTTNPVPLIIVSRQTEGQRLGKSDAPGTDLSLLRPLGGLSDVAPTILKIMGLKQPTVMTGHSLL